MSQVGAQSKTYFQPRIRKMPVQSISCRIKHCLPSLFLLWKLIYVFYRGLLKVYTPRAQESIGTEKFCINVGWQRPSVVAFR